MGVYYAGHGNLDKAIDCFHNASRINPHLASFCANAGMAYLAQGKPKEAEVDLRQAVEIDPGNPSFRGSLIMALRREGKGARRSPNSASWFTCARRNCAVEQHRLAAGNQP